MKPVYSVSSADYEKAGVMIDTVVKEHFLGKKVALRYLSLQDHPSKTIDELIETIEQTGTDKYDPERKMSVAHDFYSEKGVELFAVQADVNPNLSVSAEALQDFFEGAVEDRGVSMKIDLVTVYDAQKLELIPIQYDDGIGEDAFRFKDAVNKPDAVLGFIKVSP